MSFSGITCLLLILRSYYTAAPATMHFADSTSVSSAAIAADIENYDSPVVVQGGKGHAIYSLTAESYYKLSAATTVWGHAGYYKGNIRDITFCDAIDYPEVAPFVIGDDTGGNLSSQRYDFGGGWGRSFGKWTLGVQGDYTATIAHRSVDPRVRNIVSDLNVAIGGARAIGNTYIIGLNAAVRIYNQSTDVDFYNPVTHAVTMLYTGLGSTSSRFIGADAQTSTHRMTGFNASIQLVPSSRSDRFYAMLCGKMTTSDLILDGYNDLNFGTTTTTSLSGRLSRKITAGTLTFLPTLAGEYFHRVATENLFGSSAENYLKIGERKNYHYRLSGASLDIPVTWHITSKNAQISFSLHGGFYNNKEYLVEPARSLDTSYYIGGVSLGYTKKLGRLWTAGVQAGYDGRFIASTTAVWAGLDLSSPEGEMTLHNYSMSSCAVNSAQAALTVTRSINDKELTFTASYTHHDYKSLNKGHHVFTALSLSF